MNFVLFLISFVFTAKSLYVFSESCLDIPWMEKICTSKFYNPQDLINIPTYKPIEITFLKLKGNVSLISPKEFYNKTYENAIYKRFYIAESCIKDIQNNYFDNIDRNNKALIEITFKRITCLNKLSTKSFQGIGKYVKQLTFDSILDLKDVDKDFFDSFIVLEKLDIINTSISVLPLEIISKMPKLNMVNITNNKLTYLPQIPFEKKDLIGKLYAYSNPFNCQCSLKHMVDMMKAVLFANMYKCATPEKHKGKALVEVDFCVQQNVTEESKIYEKLKKGNIKAAATGHVRIEIIIAVSLCILVLVVIIIAVFIYKRLAQKKNGTPIYQHISPSKIVFQNVGESKQPLIFQYQEV